MLSKFQLGLYMNAGEMRRKVCWHLPECAVMCNGEYLDSEELQQWKK